MREKRRQELSEEASERIEREELGFGSFGGGGLVDGKEASHGEGVMSSAFRPLFLWNTTCWAPSALARCLSSRGCQDFRVTGP